MLSIGQLCVTRIMAEWSGHGNHGAVTGILVPEFWHRNPAAEFPNFGQTSVGRGGIFVQQPKRRDDEKEQ
jgi:hypothetical protein